MLSCRFCGKADGSPYHVAYYGISQIIVRNRQQGSQLCQICAYEEYNRQRSDTQTKRRKLQQQKLDDRRRGQASMFGDKD